MNTNTDPDPCARCLQADDACQCYAPDPADESTPAETPRSDAERYARSIADELREWDYAADGDPDALAALADERESDRADEAADVAEYLNACALDVEVLRDKDRDRVRVEIVRTYGGPNCRIVWDDRYPANFEVTVHWGGDYARRETYAPTLGDQMRELYA